MPKLSFFNRFLLPFIVSICLFSLPSLASKSHVTLEEKISQMIIVGFNGTDSNSQEVTALKTLISQEKVGGVIFYRKNILKPNQTKSLIQSIVNEAPSHTLFVAVDQEGGTVQRFSYQNGFKSFPSAETIAKTRTPAEAYGEYLTMAELLSTLGFNVNFGAVVDLDSNPNSKIIHMKRRSFSKNPKVVTSYAKEMINAHRKKGIIVALKHFPGHGSVVADTHTELADITDTWQPKELLPYQDLIQTHHVDMIMTAHLTHRDIDKDYPASISRKHVTSLLRNTLNYSGVVISDDLHMVGITKGRTYPEIILKAVQSGTDILLFSTLYNGKNDIPTYVQSILLDAIEKGELDPDLIDRAYSRIMRLKKSISPSPKTSLGVH